MSNIPKQHEIVEELDKQMAALDGVKQLAKNSRKEIERILGEVWEE